MNNPIVDKDSAIRLEDFSKEWLNDLQAGNPSTIELGRRFGRKLVTQWLDVSEGSDDLVYCDGTGDGGIDVAYLDRGETAAGEEGAGQGHTWYLVQSKFGKAFQGAGTLLAEGQKVIDTLDGRRARLSSLAEGLLDRLKTFRANASERDRIVLVFAAVAPLDDNEKRLIGDLRAMGRERLGGLFDVESVSIETIYQRNLDMLDQDFRAWARVMDERHGIYLEIQRGGWDSRRALQGQKPAIKQFAEAANAFDLLKVYGSGWLGEAGLAFSKNAPFLPNGAIFKRIMDSSSATDEDPFGVDDLYAAYRLQREAKNFLQVVPQKVLTFQLANS
jgi:hypothetical protein